MTGIIILVFFKVLREVINSSISLKCDRFFIYFIDYFEEQLQGLPLGLSYYHVAALIL